MYILLYNNIMILYLSKILAMDVHMFNFRYINIYIYSFQRLVNKMKQQISGLLFIEGTISP